MKLRSAEGVLVPALFSVRPSEFGKEFVDEAWDEFFLWEASREDVEPQGVRDDIRSVLRLRVRAGFRRRRIAGRTGRRSPWPCTSCVTKSSPLQPFHLEFIEQACKSPASFFVVEAVAPGRSLDIKDVLTGPAVSRPRTERVSDPDGRRSDVHEGRHRRRRSILIGACPWVIPASWHISVIDMRERIRRKRLLTREQLLDYDLEIRGLYHEIVDALCIPGRPSCRTPTATRSS